MVAPIDNQASVEVSLLDEDAREFYEERAGIMEYMGRMTRDAAERLALEETRKYIASRATRK